MSSTVVNKTYHPTEVDAVRFGEQYKQQFHPCGYGTTCSVWFDAASGQWVLSTYRYSSCD